jgi:hypothetical protein
MSARAFWRGHLAGVALDEYRDVNPDSESLSREELMIDLVADLLYLATRESIDPLAILSMARIHFEAES